jgi:hypothetical protein
MAELAVWQIYVMEYACLKDHPWVDFISGMYHEGTTNFPFSFVLAQCGDRNVLVDTGFMQEDHRSGFSLKFGIPTWISPVRMLREMKLAPEAITDIVITHAHFDHMGSIAEFPNAHIYIQKSELLSWYEAFALPPRFAHLTAIVDPDNIRSALDASIAHRVTLVDGDKNNVLPGIHIRLGADIRSVSNSWSSRRRPAAESSRATACTRGASSLATTTTASTCRSTTPSAASGSNSRRSTRCMTSSAAI